MKLLKQRETEILKYTKNKIVLDIGCIDHNLNKIEENIWLHKLIKQNAKYLLGIDYDREKVNLIEDYNIIYGNAENFKINKKFDVIVAGEIIEHLANVGLFLDSARKHLKKDGLLIITTPNVWGIRRIIRMLLNLQIQSNEEHCLWYDEDMLWNILDRQGFEPIEYYYYLDPHHSKIKYYFEYFFSIIKKRFAPNIMIVSKKREVR